MSAVDNFDQYRAYIKLEFRTGKFWHPMFLFIVESTFVNAWVLHVATRKAANLPLQFDHVQFRRRTAMSLAAEWEAKGCRNKPVPNTSTVHSPTTMLKTVQKGKRVHLKKLCFDKDAAADPSNHFAFIARLPAVDGLNNNQRQQVCYECDSSSRTSFWCSVC